MKKLVTALVMSLSLAALAAPPALKGPPPAAARGEGHEGHEGREGRGEKFAQRAHLAAVVGISEALELSEADALKLGEKLKAFEARRQPLRQQMHEAMQTVKAAADNDAEALPKVDQAVQQVLDGRAQMAALDKELFNSLAQGQSPQKKAKLALFLAHFRQGMREGAQGHEGRPGRR